MPEVAIEGRCAPGLESVRDAFAQGFRSRGEVGAAVAVTIDGEPAIDLWGGHADATHTRPFAEDTLVCMMSVAKAVTATCVAILVDRGALEWDAPVARYWPEFARSGKEAIPVRWCLDHRAGLPVVEGSLLPGAAYDWDLVTGALAAQAPIWPPGTRRAYHSVTMGYLAGEIVRRVAGASIGTFLAREVCAPLGVEYWIGLPEAEHGRCAAFFGETRGTLFDRDDPDSLLARAMALVDPAEIDTARFRSAEIPSINGIGSARGVARLFGALACGGTLDGVRLLGESTLAEATSEQWSGTEDLLGHTRRMGMGFLLGTPGHVAMGPSPRAFGHTGAGGAIGFADPDARVGFAYAPNHMYSGPGASPRLAALVDALYLALR
jgi:CubicO group peptidase (beta-lactamase class C family)